MDNKKPSKALSLSEIEKTIGLDIPVKDEGKCPKCELTLNLYEMFNASIIKEDAIGLPVPYVKCPNCGTIFEWELRFEQ